MTNHTPALNMTMFYSYYSTLSTEQLNGLLYLYEDDCLLFQYPCAEHVENIKQFKLLNPNHKHEYKSTWSGIIGDPDTISWTNEFQDFIALVCILKTKFLCFILIVLNILIDCFLLNFVWFINYKNITFKLISFLNLESHNSVLEGLWDLHK